MVSIAVAIRASGPKSRNIPSEWTDLASGLKSRNIQKVCGVATSFQLLGNSFANEKIAILDSAPKLIFERNSNKYFDLPILSGHFGFWRGGWRCQESLLFVEQILHA